MGNLNDVLSQLKEIEKGLLNVNNYLIERHPLDKLLLKEYQKIYEKLKTAQENLASISGYNNRMDTERIKKVNEDSASRSSKL